MNDEEVLAALRAQLVDFDARRFGRYFNRAGEQLTLMEWAHLRETSGMEYLRVAHTMFAEAVEVSTVWLGLDHSFTGQGPPLIFETMIFGHTLLDAQLWRYTTEDEARAGHEEVVALVRMELELT